MKCYLCQNDINIHNTSEEHILPNCIGGKLKSKGLLCSTCNGVTSVYETELDKLASVFMVHYKIKRDRDGYAKPIKAVDEKTDKDVLYHKTGIVTFSDPEVNIEGEKITIEAYSKDRALNELAKLKKELDAKGIGMDLSEMNIEEKTNPDDRRPLYTRPEFNPDILVKSILKILLNLYIYKGGEPKYISKVIQFINDVKRIDNRYCNQYDKNIARDYFNGKPHHIAILKNDKREIKGYFELFGVIGFIAVISTEYEGEDFHWQYTYDSLSHQEIDFICDFNEKVYDIYNYFYSIGIGGYNSVQLERDIQI